jgi:alkane 1-monooxygenase
MSKFKYFIAYLLPIIVFISLQQTGYKSFLALFVFFVLLPLIELFVKPNNSNFTRAHSKVEKKKKIYDWILYLILPIQYALLIYFLFNVSQTEFLSTAFFGKITAMGLACGVLGINVGHELGHKNHRFYQLLGELLLLTSLNTHFLPYHNAGHHYLVATPEDPATARKNESLYLFWFRSHFGSYFLAWKLEFKRINRLGMKKFCTGNRMIFYAISNVLVVVSIYVFFDWKTLLGFLGAATFGIILLETVNYIEHYGLLRRKINNQYERTSIEHSWNSDHPISRLFLFNLSRHSDHHKNGSKKYQLLSSHDESPQMPTGYPGMVLLALIPPLWFGYMNKRLKEYEAKKIIL